MKLAPVLVSAGLCLSLATSATLGQTTPAKPVPTKPAITQSMSKDSIAKACSAQADSKGLHGAERKKFRSECKRNGGKA
jgi:hypothetical protein